MTSETLSKHSSEYWENIRKQTGLFTFDKAARSVPAYKRLLTQKNLRAGNVRSWDDFVAKVPTVTKKDYLRKHELSSLMCEDSLKTEFLEYSTSSGSTGVPFYYPRFSNLSRGYGKVLEAFINLRPAESTLVIVCFGMGVWIGGVHTYEALVDIGKHRKGLSVIAPGVSKSEIYRAVTELGKSYDQIILAGYPPFIKDVVDDLNGMGAFTKPGKFRFFFAAEVFTEEFRDYVTRIAKCTSVFTDTMNIYGTSDIGAMARETPLAILIRRLVGSNVELRKELFGSEKMPTLAQYDPHDYVFENIKGTVHVTAPNVLPFVRFSLGDRGGAFSYDEVVALFASKGIDIKKEAEKAGIPLWKMPFVFVLERDDFSVSLYGLQIYPEYLRPIMLDKPIDTLSTGRFVLEIQHNKKHDQYLAVHLEMKEGEIHVDHKTVKLVHDVIHEGLRSRSSEFKELTNHVKEKDLLQVNFHPYASAPYFTGSVKQRWVMKDVKKK